MATATTISPDFDTLSLAEQILYVQELWDRIAARAAEGPLTEAWRIELERRIAEDDADPDAGASWEEVRERIRRRRT